MPVTNRVRELRGGLSLTQEKLADLAGVSRQTINSIETGRFEPSLTLALVLARVFETPVEQIFSLSK